MNCPDGHKAILDDLNALRAILGSTMAVFASSDFDKISEPLYYFQRFEQTGLKK